MRDRAVFFPFLYRPGLNVWPMIVHRASASRGRPRNWMNPRRSQTRRRLNPDGRPAERVDDHGVKEQSGRGIEFGNMISDEFVIFSDNVPSSRFRAPALPILFAMMCAGLDSWSLACIRRPLTKLAS
jgi:hypothetical protein